MEGYVERVVEARRREVAKALSRSSIGESVEVHRPLADLIIDRCEGMRINGKLDGVCRAIFKDGHQYEGEMERSKITGRGTYTWPDESTYSGGVVNGIRHGYGVYYSPVTRTTYSGHWVNGKREGKGHLAYCTGPGRGGQEREGEEGGEGGGNEEGESFYDGEWKNNRQHGTGVRRYRSGNEYRGQWREGVKEGEGEVVWGGGRREVQRSLE
ncbi:Radial spoke head 10 homolog B [Geodia barretti]|uniref:Radial spoke head 10 homolog B n=1 Tax=Geodia barretti TaxID=519541 RepID=A0AA35WPP2_GEOBA|nr:Radial spoke head 10 homolog B [Geodia barretti]